MHFWLGRPDWHICNWASFLRPWAFSFFTKYALYFSGFFWALEGAHYSIQLFNRLVPLTQPIISFRAITMRYSNIFAPEIFKGFVSAMIWNVIFLVFIYLFMKLRKDLWKVKGWFWSNIWIETSAQHHWFILSKRVFIHSGFCNFLWRRLYSGPKLNCTYLFFKYLLFFVHFMAHLSIEN